MSRSPLLGLAIGDALGMPFETRRFDDPLLLEWDGTMVDSHRTVGPDMPAGTTTDDTAMACALGRAILQGSYSPEAVAKAYKSIEDRSIGFGSTTLKALENLDKGVPWCSSGILGAAGNGAAMRAPVLGLLYPPASPNSFEFQNYVDWIARFAKIDATITHDSDEARDGSVIIALTTYYLYCGFSPQSAVSNAIDHVKDSKTQVVQKCKHLITYPMYFNSKTPVSVYHYLGVSARVWDTVPLALIIFLSCSGECFESRVIKAVRCGGDTDTLAAIVGALSGMYFDRNTVKDFYTNQKIGDLWKNFEYVDLLDTKLQDLSRL